MPNFSTAKLSRYTVIDILYIFTDNSGTDSPLPIQRMVDKPIHIDEFEAYVEAMHLNFNQQFESQFKVCSVIIKQAFCKCILYSDTLQWWRSS